MMSENENAVNFIAESWSCSKEVRLEFHSMFIVVRLRDIATLSKVDKEAKKIKIKFLQTRVKQLLFI
jgi:hypothetical protein